MSAPIITGMPLSKATVGQPYSASQAIVGGKLPYTLVKHGQSLPAGLTQAVKGSTVVTTGTPVVDGQFKGLTTWVKDATGATIKMTGTFSITVAKAGAVPPVVTPPVIPPVVPP